MSGIYLYIFHVASNYQYACSDISVDIISHSNNVTMC
jgi:hypothetical protein